MGWAFCGKNRATGAEMGYGVDGVCDHPECAEEIDHGLSYVCGGMHEGGELGCGRYFCGRHLTYVENGYDGLVQVCHECAATVEAEIEREERADLGAGNLTLPARRFETRYSIRTEGLVEGFLSFGRFVTYEEHAANVAARALA